MFAIRGLTSNGIATEAVCFRCYARINSLKSSNSKKSFSSSQSNQERIKPTIIRRRAFRREYFTTNGALENGGNQGYSSTWRSGGAKPKFRTTLRSVAGEQPVQRLPQAAVQPRNLASEPLDRRRIAEVENLPVSTGTEHNLPLDASSRLSTISSRLPQTSLRRRFTTYLALSKPRLSFLMVLTTATAYSLYPVPAVLLPSATVAPSLSALTLVFLTGGTALCSASANSLNMLLEPEHDAKMSRTRNRPLVRGLISKRGALIFAGVTGAVGIGGLWFGVNPTVAFLGGFTIFLYAGVYTPMKRISVVNTWIGAVVGSIPPLMGWAAAAGQSATGSGDWRELLLGEENIGGWLLASLLFAWQFPHFNAFSWTIREEYKGAGYKMLAWTNSKMNSRVACRYALLFFPICFGLTWYSVTDRGFLVTSSVVNAWLVREAWKFWRKQGQMGSARLLFWASIWHLPVLMVLAMIHKKGFWEGIWRRVAGENEENLAEDSEQVEDELPEDYNVNDIRPTLSLASTAS
ncbi:Protoheme IX farnesyltransferase, mitochondrial [Ptychographa xylographoides]|nr:Protoheme IX farnesyltransferase, mitochondrial [Ptychographa xylographoides]